MSDARAEEAEDVLRHHFVDAKGRAAGLRPFHQRRLQGPARRIFRAAAGYALQELADEWFLAVLDRKSVGGPDRHEAT